MTWFKVDDGFWSHPKVMTLSDGAVALWVKAGTYSCQHLTDGHIPTALLRFLGTDESAEDLVDAGLWINVDDGYLFHDWDEYQETSDDVKKRREQARERQRKRRAARESPGDRQGSNAPVTRDTPRDSRRSSQKVSTPDPTRPDPTRPIKDKDMSDSDESDEPAPKPKKTRRHEYSPEFEEFWKTYPTARGASKFETSQKFTVALKAADAETIIAGATRFADDPNLDVEFAPMPTTWLNKRRWEAAPLPSRNSQETQTKSDNSWEGWFGRAPNPKQDTQAIFGTDVIDHQESHK